MYNYVELFEPWIMNYVELFEPWIMLLLTLSPVLLDSWAHILIAADRHCRINASLCNFWAFEIVS